jgi:pimeloyl-ACP methyl ester carboxylesterase
MTTSYLEVDGGRIAYEVSGDGPLVVCVPGMGDVRQVFRHTAPALVAAGYRVAVMDLRGHGDSDTTFADHGDPATARDLLALIAHLGGPAVVLGSSMGAAAAVLAAAERPAAVTGFVLLGPFVRDGLSKPMELVTRLALLKPWGPAFWRSYYRRFYPGRPPADLAAHIERIGRAQARPGAWTAFVRTVFAGHAEAAAVVDRVRGVPTLVVMGEKDPDWKDPVAEGTWVADTLGGELLRVPAAGHYPMAEYPETVNPAVVAFVGRVVSRA